MMTSAHATKDRSPRSIAFVDVMASGRYDSRGQRRMRGAMYDLIGGVVEYEGLSLSSLAVSDRGDGLRLVIPPDVIHPTRVVDTFTLHLATQLRDYRLNAGTCIRMRIAFDFGLVEPHLRDWAGDPLVRVARLLDAEALRKALHADSTLDLAALVSDPMYESVVRHGSGLIAPDFFTPVRVAVKEFDGRAWLLTPHAAGLRCSGDHAVGWA